MKAPLTVLLVAVDPVMGGLAGNAEAFSELGDRIEPQLVVFEESLPLLAHSNTSPGHGHHLLAERSVTHVPPISVTYVLRIFCNLCLGTVRNPLADIT